MQNKSQFEVSHRVSLGVHPAEEQAGSNSCTSADVKEDGPPVLPLLLFLLRVGQSLFHLLDLLCSAGNPLFAMSLPEAA